jgi:hypothetical protein
MEFNPAINEELYREVAYRHKLSPKQVEEFFTVFCNFTEDVISKGGMETVMWPHFGKFAVKTKLVQFLADKEFTKPLIDDTPRT